eukprot:gene6715-biopygen13813
MGAPVVTSPIECDDEADKRELSCSSFSIPVELSCSPFSIPVATRIKNGLQLRPQLRMSCNSTHFYPPHYHIGSATGVPPIPSE